MRFKFFNRSYKLKLQIFTPVFTLFLAVNAFSEVWGDAPKITKRRQQVVEISTLIGETESVNRQCIASGKFIGFVVKGNFNESRTMISNFVVRREHRERIKIYLSETLGQRLDDQQLIFVKQLLSAKSRLEIGMFRCRTDDGSLTYAASIQKL